MMKNPFKQKTGVELEVPLPLCLQSEESFERISLFCVIIEQLRSDIKYTEKLL